MVLGVDADGYVVSFEFLFCGEGLPFCDSLLGEVVAGVADAFDADEVAVVFEGESFVAEGVEELVEGVELVSDNVWGDAEFDFAAAFWVVAAVEHFNVDAGGALVVGGENVGEVVDGHAPGGVRASFDGYRVRFGGEHAGEEECL